MGAMVLCGLYTLLGLALFCLVVAVLWYVFTKIAAAMGVTVDQRIWQLVGVILLIVFLIALVSWLMGGACGFLASVRVR